MLLLWQKSEVWDDMSKPLNDLVTYSFERGQAVLAERSDKYRKEHGQFLTPPAVARYMARQLGGFRAGDRILDPAIGSGVLACAIIEQIIAEMVFPENFG